MYLLKNLGRIEKSFKHLFFEGLNEDLIETNLIETSDCYDIEYVVPGFRKEELSVTVEGKYLIVEGKKEGKGIKFNRNIYLPGVKSISAKLENGILTVSIPKEKIKKEKIVVDIE
jgi:HSP20 family molecular chaperone IbpA